MLTALVIGGADCAFDDARAALELVTPDAVCGIKDMIADWPGRLDYGASLHAERNAEYLRRRALARYPGRPVIWSHKPHIRMMVDASTEDWGGSSGLFAVAVMRREGFERIILAGVPMDDRRHYKRGKRWADAKRYRNAWMSRYNDLAPFVRSMSGWTRELFGPPDADWIGANATAGRASQTGA